MPSCQKCGKELKAEAVFCTSCGTPVTSYSSQRADKAPKPQAQPSPPPPKSKAATVAYFIAGLVVICAALYGVSVLYMGYSIRKASTSGFHKYNSGHYIECARHFHYLTRKVPKNEENWAMLGECLALSGDNTEAARTLKNALKWHPDSPHLLTLIGTALFNQGKYEAASEHFQKAIEEDPTNSLPHFHLGLTLEKMKKTGPAIEHLEKALPTMDGNKLKVLEPLSHLYFSSGNYEKAAERLEEAIKIDPNKFSIRLAAGKTYYAMKDFRKALLQAEAALAIEPKSQEAKKLVEQVAGTIDQNTERGYLELRRELDKRYLELYNDANSFITRLNEKMEEMLGKENPELEQLEQRVAELQD
ncbi:MAG: tetratricopeptide repeat protein, partial [bacterium]